MNWVNSFFYRLELIQFATGPGGCPQVRNAFRVWGELNGERGKCMLGNNQGRVGKVPGPCREHRRLLSGTERAFASRPTSVKSMLTFHPEDSWSIRSSGEESMCVARVPQQRRPMHACRQPNTFPCFPCCANGRRSTVYQYVRACSSALLSKLKAEARVIRIQMCARVPALTTHACMQSEPKQKKC